MRSQLAFGAWFFCLISCVFALFLTGCAPAVVKPVVEGPAFHADIGTALKYISRRIAAQVSIQDLEKAKTIPVDLFFNEYSAEGAATAKGLQPQLVAVMAEAMPNAGFAALTTRNIQTAQLVLLAGYTNVKQEEAGRAGNWVRLKVVLADVKTGAHVADVMTYLDAAQFNSAPSRFSKEAPMYLTDAAHKDRAAVLSGEKRAIGVGMRLRAELGEAIDVYESGQYADSEVRFRKIIETAPSNTGALSGLYQALWRQDKKAEAEKIFGRLALAGIDAGILSVKILFKLSSTDFIEETDLSQQYLVWLRAISQQVAEKKVCLDVTGHASASGSVDFNDKLSLSRASRIVTRMQQLTPATASLLKAYGKGSSEAVVGTGANDVTDAIDRRVAFAVRSCS